VPSPTGMAPLPKTPSGSSPSSPLATAKSPPLSQQGNPGSQAPGQDWVTVGERRKLRNGQVSPSGLLSAHPSPLQIGKTTPVQIKHITPQLSPGSLQTKSPQGPKAANPESMPTHQLPLTTFLRTGRTTGPQAVRHGSGLRLADPSSGPSALLTAAVESAHTTSEATSSETGPKAKAGKWTMSSAEVPTNLRAILAEQTPTVRPREGPKKERKKSDEATKCAWGFEAMPSEQPKGKSMYDLQSQETQERECMNAEQELLEIEAMFAALEVAEREEENELLQSHDPSTSADGKKAAKSRKKGPSKGAMEGASSKGKKVGRKGGKGAQSWSETSEKSRSGKGGKTRHSDMMSEASTRGQRWAPKSAKPKTEDVVGSEM